MQDLYDLTDLQECRLCEHRCGVDRLSGETGVCRMTMPIVASAALHPAPPESYTVFMAGCNFKCLHCQNWSISQYPDNAYGTVRGQISPGDLARECVSRLDSYTARAMGADRIFFSGGEPEIHLPYIEKVVQEARSIEPGTKVNFDTNGYLTEESLERVLAFTNSVTFDLKAFDEQVSYALTGASSEPVLRNAEYLGKYGQDRLWEYRITVIPQINENQIRDLAGFLADIDPHLPVCFLAFRPNFVLEDHFGASKRLMQDCINVSRECGLKNVSFAGKTDIPGRGWDKKDMTMKGYSREALIADTYALNAGCRSFPRDCKHCGNNQECAIKQYVPARVT